MSTVPLTWPPASSHDLNPPEDHHYASALWLCGRHPKLVELVERVPGAVVRDEEDGGLWFELDVLAEALAALDAHRAAWQEYERTTWQPHDDDAFAAWEARGPKHTHPGSEAIGVMSRTEASRLRLLAFFAPPTYGGRGLSAADLAGFDDEGRRLLHDWTLAVLYA